MSAEMYRQCVLQKGDEKTTSWLPERSAKKGKSVKLKIYSPDSDNQEWDFGWKVLDVGRVRKPEYEIQERSQDYKNTRKASDI